MAKEKEKLGTRADLKKWLEKQHQLTLTRYHRLPHDVKMEIMGKYLKGAR